MIAIIAGLVAALVGHFGSLGYWPALVYAASLPILYRVDTELLWAYFLAVMRLQMVRDAGKLPADAEPIAKNALMVGMLLDLVYNWAWAVIVFRDWPRELLVTQRLERYKYGRAYRLQWSGGRVQAVRCDVKPATGWRAEKTERFCAVRLDPYDPNPAGHVRP